MRVINSTRSGYLQLETISLVPFRQNLIKRELLTGKEVSILDKTVHVVHDQKYFSDSMDQRVSQHLPTNCNGIHTYT